MFRDIVFNDEMSAVFKHLGWEKPLVPQCMYIYKQPGIGGEVKPHTDNTFLYNEGSPDDGLVGLWLALEDATPTNGCLQYVPGSHIRKEGAPMRRFVMVCTQ